jgi:hypothetical protein
MDEIEAAAELARLFQRLANSNSHADLWRAY